MGAAIERSALMGLVALAMISCGETEPPKPPTFRVGGSVTGLAASLTLQLNGEESLTRSENGPFYFQSQLEDQSPFTVAITMASAEQECLLQDAAGKVNGADVNSVRVSCAQRQYTLGGTVEGLTAPLQLRLNEGEILSLSTNGPFTFQTKLPKGSSYMVTVPTQPPAQRCAITNGNGTVAGKVESLAVRCAAWYTFTTPFQPAAWIIGQSGPTENEPNRGNPTGQDTLTGPWGNPTLAGGKLYISDLGSTRILGFNGLPRQNITPAEFVLGQSNFENSAQGAGRTGLANPSGASSDGTWLAVADKRNSRVLLYRSLPTQTGAAADLVLGQPGFDSTADQCGRNSLTYPENALIGHGKLIVADTYNNRVLVWNAIPTSNGVPPDLVLGQTTFNTCAGNDKDGDGGLDTDRLPSASTLWLPHGLWTDGKRLVVVDTNNSRVLIWNQFPTNNGQSADVVLGQPDFTSPAATTTTQSSLSSPTFVSSTGQQLFVADTSNHRVLIWDGIPTSNNTPANAVLGQRDFTSNTEYDPPTGTAPSARSLYLPGGVLLTGPYVVVADRGNNRLVVFESP